MNEIPPVSNKRPLLVVFVTVLLDLIGFGIIIPIQPFLAEQFGASAAVVTLLGASYSFMQFLFAPFWGRLSDRFGRRPIILMSVAVSCVGYVLFGFASNLAMLFFARMLAGFGNANIGTAQAVVADCTTIEGRSRGMGMIGASFGLGFIIGPLLGGLFVQHSLATPAFVAAGLAAINFLMACFWLPETNKQRGVLKEKIPLRRSLPELWRLPNLSVLLSIVFLVVWGFAMVEQSLALFVQHVFAPQAGALDVSGASMKHAARLTSYVLLVVGITAVIVQGGLIRHLVRRLGERHLILAGCAVLIAAFLCFPLVESVPHFSLMLGCGALLALGFGVVNPCLQGLISRGIDGDRQGLALGASQSLSSLGRVLGPAMAGQIFEVHPTAPFLWATGLVVICLILAPSIRERATAPAS